jgi:hypothetical protein
MTSLKVLHDTQHTTRDKFKTSTDQIHSDTKIQSHSSETNKCPGLYSRDLELIKIYFLSLSMSSSFALTGRRVLSLSLSPERATDVKIVIIL